MDSPPVVADLAIETDDGYMLEGPANVRAFKGEPYASAAKWELTIEWCALPTARVLPT
ncbi:MAG: hypothetical protein JNM10_09830 [Planctomycetia bacterium]|nr:hypothetical protein [Planctomycetia bacterium]